jgi:hypothetical protein
LLVRDVWVLGEAAQNLADFIGAVTEATGAPDGMVCTSLD